MYTVHLANRSRPGPMGMLYTPVRYCVCDVLCLLYNEGTEASRYGTEVKVRVEQCWLFTNAAT